MPSLLEGQLAKTIFAGFKGKLLKGRLRRLSVGDSAGLDPAGDPISPTPQFFGCEGFTDKYSAFTKAQAGIPDTDLKVCIFGASLPAGFVPREGDQVLFKGQWYQLRDAGTDPADALWECQGFAIPAPEDA